MKIYIYIYVVHSFQILEQLVEGCPLTGEVYRYMRYINDSMIQ